MTTHPDYELLMAYVDGELDSEQAARVEARLESDAQVRELVEQIRSTNALLRQGLDEVLEQPVPQRLLDTLQGPTPVAPVIPLRPRAAAARPRTGLGLGWAAAASIVLAIGAVGTVSLLVPSGPNGLGIVDNRVLQQALETLPSGTPLISDDTETSVTPLATYRSGDSRPCREFEIRQGATVQLGLACRGGDGRWDLDTLVEQEIVATDPGAQGYVPAGGEGDPISAVLDRIGAGAALVVAEEQTLIDAEWSNGDR